MFLASVLQQSSDVQFAVKLCCWVVVPDKVVALRYYSASGLLGSQTWPCVSWCLLSGCEAALLRMPFPPTPRGFAFFSAQLLIASVAGSQGLGLQRSASFDPFRHLS